jgi:uncharacterized protein YcbX
MNCVISSISYSPIKSLSFKIVKSCYIKKSIGILNDRIFALSKNISFEKAKIIEKNPNERKLSHFLTLKNTPILNKYNFEYINDELSLLLDDKRIFSVKLNDQDISSLITNKFFELERSLNGPFFLLKNKDFPFYDTTHTNEILNSISLINHSSINDFEKKIGQKIEPERFRGNFYIKGIDAWAEREWVNKIIKINNIFFKVEKNISRCSATNLQPGTDKKTINLPNLLKTNYTHIDMGIYLTPMNDGEVMTGNKIELKISK